MSPHTISASYNLSDYQDVLDTHQFEVSSTALMEYSGWIHGSEDEIRAARAPSGMISRKINTMSPGNSGLVAQRKVELRRERIKCSMKCFRTLFHLKICVKSTTQGLNSPI